MNNFANTLNDVQTDIGKIQEALGRVIVGQDKLIEHILIAVFANGHILLEGLPGLGKTHIAKATAAALGLELGRVQCTPDLLPADITGSEVLVGGGNQIEFRRGPVFANLLLVDEINRSTPRTQSALLEAMQEKQVTYAGERHLLPAPFVVIATQNPIELEGTFPLPEAQLDRFLFKVDVSFPSPGSLQKLLDISLDAEPADVLSELITKPRTVEIAETARSILVSEPVKRAAINLILATQRESESAANAAREHIRYGASPRALQALVRAARVRAMFAGRAQIDYEDLEDLALPVLSHRILLATQSELNGVTIRGVLDDLLREWRAGSRT